MDDKNYPKVYLANGVLVDENKVLTTRHFLKKYQLNVEKEELYVYCVKREFKRDIIKVIRVEINMAKNGRLAIAHVSSLTYFNDLNLIWYFKFVETFDNSNSTIQIYYS